MIETISFLLGLGFSLLVYFLSIRPLDQPWPKKIGYFFFTFIGITGTIFLIGVLIAHFLRKMGVVSSILKNPGEIRYCREISTGNDLRRGIEKACSGEHAFFFSERYLLKRITCDLAYPGMDVMQACSQCIDRRWVLDDPEHGGCVSPDRRVLMLQKLDDPRDC